MKKFLIAALAVLVFSAAAEACGPLARVVGRVQERRVERRMGVISFASVVRSSSVSRSVQQFVPIAPPVAKTPCSPAGCPVPKK